MLGAWIHSLLFTSTRKRAPELPKVSWALVDASFTAGATVCSTPTQVGDTNAISPLE